MKTKKISLVELKSLVKKIIKEENERTIKISDLEKNWKKYFPEASNQRDIQLVTDSQDVREIHNMYSDSTDFDGFFVHVGDGDYTNIYGFEGTVPKLSKNLYKVL